MSFIKLNIKSINIKSIQANKILIKIEKIVLDIESHKLKSFDFKK